MSDEDEAPDDGEDPLALVSKVVELMGLALSVWYLWRLVKDDPDLEILRRRWSEKVRGLRRARNLQRVDTVADEAALILEMEGKP